MATKDQYEFFQSLYEEEERTAQQLEGRAKVYLGIISAFLVTLFLKTDDAIRSARSLGISFPWLLFEGLILSGALILVILALRIRVFEAVNDGVDIIVGYPDSGVTDEVFFEDRIADYAVASSRNRAVNNQTSALLAWSSWFIITGMLLLPFVAIVALRRAQ